MSRSAGAAPDAWVDEGPLPLHRFRQIPRAELLRVLDGAGRSKKLLFIEEELKPMLLSSVGNPTALTERGVPAQLPLRRIEKQNLAQSWVNSWPAEVKAVIYVMRPTLTNSHLLVRHASELRQYARNNGTVLTFHLLSVPRPSGICTRLLQDHGLLGDFGGGTGKLASMPLHAWPLDRDLLSMEDASVFRQLATSRYKDPTPLYGIGQALMFLLEAEGIVPNIKAIGHAGVMLKNLIVKLMLSREAKRKTPTAVSSRISGLVLIDRAVDVVAATALQTTFQGYIEEALGLEAGQKVVFQAPAAAPAAAAAAQGGALSPRSSADGSAGAGAREQMRVVLQPDDEVWQAYKEMALADVSGPVGAQQLSVTRELDSRKGAAVGRGVREMGALFSEIQALRDQSARLKQLTTLLEVLLDTKDGSGRKEELGAVDDFIASVAWGASEHRQSREQLLSCIDSLILQRQPLTRVLRLMTLYSAVSRPHWTSDDKRLRELMKQVLACYGPQHAATLHALYAAGLLPYHPVVPDFGAAAQQQPAPSARNLFATLAQKLHLLMPDDQRPEELQRAEGTLSKRCFEADDPRYVLANTYMPLSAKLLELGVKGRWGERGVAEHLKLLPFPLTDARLEPGDRKLVEKPLDCAADITRPLAPLVGTDAASPPAPVVVVVLIGGGPYAELSAMRMVLRRLRVRPLFLTTKVLNGTDLIRSFVPDAVVQAQDAAEQLMLSLRSTARGAAGANRTG